MYLPSYNFSPRYLSGQSAWVQHLPFGYDLVAMLKPSLVVELGTWLGDSFFTFCQAVQEERIAATCYAVDHWQGDGQTGPAGFSLFETVQQHGVQHYQSFAYLMRSEFKDAAQEFGAGTIDLLHIDGFHSYESARQDFETWFPLVREGGVILFHDIKVRSSLDHREFGVWKLWDELKQQYETREFRHGYGLGVLLKGKPSALVTEWLEPANFKRLNPSYETRGKEIEKLAAKQTVEFELATLRRQHEVLKDMQAKQSVTLAGTQSALAANEGRISEYPKKQEAFEKKLKETRDREKTLQKIIKSAEAWQRRSWFTRAFHKWRAPRGWNDGASSKD